MYHAHCWRSLGSIAAAGALQAAGCLRHFCKPTIDELRLIPVTSILRALSAAEIDHRNCVEKAELAAKLHSSFDRLPLAVRSDVTSLVKAPSRELVSVDVQEALQNRVARLHPDEQYSVQVFQEARPSVAHITTLTRSPGSALLPLDPGTINPGTGSGFVWDTAGHVVTNFHVIQGANNVKVTLSNQQTYEGTVVGSDPNNDLAILRLQGSPGDIVPIRVGTSHDLMVGQKVFAIGNPFGLDQTLTAGIVSSVNRQIQGIARRVIRDVIQTDAAINPGNSGGPLLDSLGRLIGVNTMIYSTGGGGNIGIGFAVPVNTVRRSAAQIIQSGRVRRGRIGLQLLGDESSMHIRKALRLPPGVIVHAVEPGSGAFQAGIRGFTANANGEPQAGDLIVAVGGERVQSSEDVAGIVEQFTVGDQVPLTVQRGHQQHVLIVPLIEYND